MTEHGNRLLRLWQRQSGRGDSEHAQAAVRIVLVGLILLYVLLSRSHWQLGSQYWTLLSLVLTAQALSLLLFGWLLWRPARSDVRRVAGMLHDYGLMATAMVLMGESMAFVYVVIMWVTVGNGMRYGARYLQAAVAMALASFSVPLIFSPYWQANLGLGIGLWLGLAAVPLYFSTLLGQLTQATEQARRASEAKTRFLANMSHEFRTPLNGLSGMTEVLATTTLDEEQRECLATIQASSRSLLSLVEEVLDISAIEAGKLRTWSEPFAPRELFTSIGLILRPQARAKGLDYRLLIDAQVPDQLVGDVVHLRQILLNLVGNAVKFTDKGHVQLEVAPLPSSSADQVWLRIAVSDTGIGVSQALRARLFEAFEQGDTSLARRHEGSGLGTTIAKGLVDALGGRIGHADNPGGGSVFWVELPLTLAVPERITATQAVAPDGDDAALADNVIAFSDPFVRHRARVRSMQVLVADDHKANRMVLQRLLQKAGHRVTCVDGGEAVLDAIAEVDFDVAVLDLHMPGISGLDLIKQARVLQAGPGPRTPVIVLSADVTPEAIERCLRAGAHCFLGKPVVASRLLDELAAIALEAQLPRAPVPLCSRPLPADNVVLDLQVLDELAELGLGQAFEAAFIQQCLDDAGNCLVAMQGDAQAAHWDRVRDHAHALKGVAGNVGLQELAAMAGQLMVCRDSELTQVWGSWQQRLQQGLVQGRQALQQRQQAGGAAVDGPGQAPAPA